MGNTAAGKAALAALSQGGEEAAERLMQPILQKLTYHPEAPSQFGSGDYWAEALYSGLVGGVMGCHGDGDGEGVVPGEAAGREPPSRGSRHPLDLPHHQSADW